MSAGPQEPTGQVVLLEANANGRRGNTAASPMGSRLMTIDAGRQAAEMEGILRAAGNPTGQMEALATLRRWQSDPRLDKVTRQRASELVWKFQPNGWDEV
jgi:hypothetical protein